MEYYIIIEEFLTRICFSAHHPLCQGVCNKSIDVSCSYYSYYNELYLKSTQGGKASHDEEDDVVEYVSYNLGSLF